MKRFVVVLIPLLLIGGFTWFMLFHGCSPSAKIVSFAVKVDGKTYMYSSLGGFITENMLSQGETPPLMPMGGLVVLDDGYYIKAGSMEEFANVLSGNFKIYPHQELSYDGYMVEGEAEVYDKKYTQEATEQIGVMRSMVKVVLTDIEKTKEHVIRWVRPPGDREAIENCVVRTVVVDRSYKPGTKTYTFEDEVVVPLTQLIEFYDPSITIEYDDEHEVLFFNL